MESLPKENLLKCEVLKGYYEGNPYFNFKEKWF
jgi:hypothetical protein